MSAGLWWSKVSPKKTDWQLQMREKGSSKLWKGCVLLIFSMQSLKTHIAIMSENNYSDIWCYDHNVFTVFSHDGEQTILGWGQAFRHSIFKKMHHLSSSEYFEQTTLPGHFIRSPVQCLVNRISYSANHMGTTSCIWACSCGQKGEGRGGQTVSDLLGLSQTTISSISIEWSRKEQITSE